MAVCDAGRAIALRRFREDQLADLDSTIGLFREQFGGEPQVVARAPGRVALLGAHTDFTGGYVLAAAVDRAVFTAIASAPQNSVLVYSRQSRETAAFTFAALTPSKVSPWSNYVRGVIAQLRQAGAPVPGLKMVIDGDVPLGGGLASSAALEVSVAAAILRLTGWPMPHAAVARLCQRAENEFSGVQSGIMDQVVSVCVREGCALFLDCRSLERRDVPLPAGYRIVVADSMKRRSLTDSAYNARRADCEKAVRLLAQVIPGVASLRDVTPRNLQDFGFRLPPEARRRAEHVVGENQRVLQGVEALEEGNAERFGQLMKESHASSRDLYESSTPELNILQEAACSVPGCTGSRLTGAGFGGCVVSLVREDAVPEFLRVVPDVYQRHTGLKPDLWALAAAQGAF